MVGTTGFEPATSRTPSVRATRLRYVPTGVKHRNKNFNRYLKRATRWPINDANLTN
jgi:hypothetical protein